MKNKNIAKYIAGILTVSTMIIIPSHYVYAEVPYDATKGFNVSKSTADDWRQRITQRRQEVIELNKITVQDTERMIEELDENGKSNIMRREVVYDNDKEQYKVRKRVKNDELRINAKYEQDMEDIRESFWAEKDNIRQEKLLHHRQLRKDHLLSKAENKHERKLAKLDQKLTLENENLRYKQAQNKLKADYNRLKVDQKIDNRYFMIGKDDVFTYYLETLNSGWISLPKKGYSDKVDEPILDAWIRLVENTELKNTNKQPEKYYLEHYYMDRNTQRIQFLSEIEITKGRPDNTIKQRRYAANQWEELIPESIEDELYHRVINNINLTKLVSNKNVSKNKKNSDSDSSPMIDFLGIYW